MKYQVEILETLRYQQEVEANSEEQALFVVQELYRNEEIVLTAEHHIGTDIQIYKED